jgi:ATP-binding cassette subfamily F protein uup
LKSAWKHPTPACTPPANALSTPRSQPDAAALQQALSELDAAQHESDALYARWAELTEKAG